MTLHSPLPADGILVGQSGGFGGLVHEFFLPASGDFVRFRSGLVAGPLLFQTLPWTTTARATQWSIALEAAGFFNVREPPVEPGIGYYVGLRMPGHQDRTLHWYADVNVIPSQIVAINVAVRQWLAAEFILAFGIGASVA